MTTPRTTAIVNFSGNAGKTTCGRNLFLRNMPGATLISIESANSDGQESVTLRGSQYGELLEFLAVSENGMIADVGASNIEELVNQMKQSRITVEFFDLFVVPVMPGVKQTTDAIATIKVLVELGVQAERIAVICNRVDNTVPVEKTFSILRSFIAESKSARLIPAHISNSDVYNRLAMAGKTLSQVLEGDREGLRAKMRGDAPAAERLEAIRALDLLGKAESAAEELDAVWHAICQG